MVRPHRDDLKSLLALLSLLPPWIFMFPLTSDPVKGCLGGARLLRRTCKVDNFILVLQLAGQEICLIPQLVLDTPLSGAIFQIEPRKEALFCIFLKGTLLWHRLQNVLYPNWHRMHFREIQIFFSFFYGRLIYPNSHRFSKHLTAHKPRETPARCPCVLSAPGRAFLHSCSLWSQPNSEAAQPCPPASTGLGPSFLFSWPGQYCLSANQR